MRTMILFTILAAASTSCASRRHMSPGYGRAARAAFQAQATPSAAPEVAPRGLDAEEARIVHGNYRTALTRGIKPVHSEGSVVVVHNPQEDKHQAR